MFCPNCGKELPEGSRICPQCGEVVEKELNAIAVKRQKEGWMKGFFSFRKMVSTTLIKFIYILGIIILTIGGIVMFFEGDEFSEGDEKILIGLGIIIIGNFLWRVICEGWILLFSIHEVLGSIEKNLMQK